MLTTLHFPRNLLPRRLLLTLQDVIDIQQLAAAPVIEKLATLQQTLRDNEAVHAGQVRAMEALQLKCDGLLATNRKQAAEIDDLKRKIKALKEFNETELTPVYAHNVDITQTQQAVAVDAPEAG